MYSTQMGTLIVGIHGRSLGNTRINTRLPGLRRDRFHVRSISHLSRMLNNSIKTKCYKLLGVSHDPEIFYDGIGFRLGAAVPGQRFLVLSGNPPGFQRLPALGQKGVEGFDRGSWVGSTGSAFSAIRTASSIRW